MVDYFKFLASLSVGSWYQNIAFYAFVGFFMYLNIDIIYSREKARIKDSKMNKRPFPDYMDLHGSPKY